MRDADGEITAEMRDELMQLLRLFGVPYVEAPSEAEAQCARLEELGLVDGVVTDDSDVWLFGGREIYKNIFNEQKYVELYHARDVETELGLERIDHICLALLLGSDYTTGVHGIGIVNATEIIRVFPGLDGLKKFKKWINDADADELLDGGKTRGTKMKRTKNELKLMSEMDRFKYVHRRARRRWRLTEGFPSQAVVDAYLQPVVDESKEKFSWRDPDFVGLRLFMSDKLSWDESEVDRHILPVMKELSQKRPAQTRIDGYFAVRYEDDKRAGKFQSKRLLEATRALRRKRNRSSLDIDTMLNSAPDGFAVVFQNPKESLSFILEQSNASIQSALTALELQRKSQEDAEDVEEDEITSTEKESQKIKCMKFLETLMKKILNTRSSASAQ